MELTELRCVFCRKGCGQKTFNGDYPFLGHFICSECFERDVRRELEGYKKKEVKWLQSILDTKHIEENSRWIIEGRLRNLKEVKKK